MKCAWKQLNNLDHAALHNRRVFFFFFFYSTSSYASPPSGNREEKNSNRLTVERKIPTIRDRFVRWYYTERVNLLWSFVNVKGKRYYVANAFSKYQGAFWQDPNARTKSHTSISSTIVPLNSFKQESCVTIAIINTIASANNRMEIPMQREAWEKKNWIKNHCCTR